MRNSTEEISLLHSTINGQLIFAGRVNVARDFTNIEPKRTFAYGVVRPDRGSDIAFATEGEKS